MANVGDKYIIEIDRLIKQPNGSVLFGVKGFNALVFDQYGLDKLEKTGKPFDKELNAYCDRHSCFDCPMKEHFPKCGEGWSVCSSEGEINRDAHMIMEADEIISRRMS